jgi:hypothetical protein
MNDQEVPSFNIVALGPHGAGKTVYLATLYDVISSGAIEKGVSITTNLTNRTWLESIYAQVVNPRADWPESTPVGGLRTVPFRCVVARPGRETFIRRQPANFRSHVFSINYFDYAGELVTEGDEEKYGPAQENLQHILSEAHVIIGVIDGMRLLDYLRDPIANRAFMHDYVRPVVAEMRAHEKVPVHFVITKWDLLHEYGFAKVEQSLLNSRGTRFGELVEERTIRRRSAIRADARPGRVRIIPVSSVGQFAKLGLDGTVEKVAEMPPEPVNVEVPLVAAIMDICVLAHEELRAREAASRARKPARGAPAGDVTLGPEGLKVPLGAVFAFFHAGVDGGVIFGQQTARLGRSLRRQYRRVSSHDLDGVKNTEGALYYVARAFGRRLAQFEAEYREAARVGEVPQPADAGAGESGQLLSSQASDPD